MTRSPAPPLAPNADAAVESASAKLLAEWFWIDRWVGSSAFLLPMEPRGLYREMLTQAWRRDARLPNDHEAIQRAVGCTPKEWKRCWPHIEKYWRVDRDSLINDTQLEVYTEAKARLERASAAGKRANAARWSERANVRPDVRTSIRSDVPPQSPPSPSPVPSLPERSQGEKVRGAARPAALTGGGVMAGALPRDHLRHSWCSERICVPDFIHKQLVGAKGGDLDAAATWLRSEWYPAVIARHAGPIGLRPEKFWPAAFEAEFPPPRPKRLAPVGPGVTGPVSAEKRARYEQVSIRAEDA
jgi:uncharacterized protein YdaU (DUF1376 family)